MQNRVLVLLSAFVVFALPTAPPAHARRPLDKLAGRIIVGAAELPLEYDSERRYVARMKKLHRKALRYESEGQKLRIHCGAFFRAPVTDGQVQVRVFDVKSGTRETRLGHEVDLNKPGDKYVFFWLTLDPEKLAPGSYELGVVSRGNLIASARLELKAAPANARPPTAQELDLDKSK